METLLDWMTPRTFLAAAALVALILAADRFGGYPRQWFDEWRYPPVGRSVGGEDIAAALDGHQSRRLHRLYGRVSSEIAAARAQGLDVTGLQEAADASLTLDTPRYRDAAIERLNHLSMAVPQRPTRTRPAVMDDESEDRLPTPPSAPARPR
ncbi:MAG: hypothetical protein HKL90_15270 [Elusimicrobia bacterium]|nr:hypothetical protein [Elusimicrobiota bacterium]